MEVLSLTYENSFNPHSVGRAAKDSRQQSVENIIDPVKNRSLYHCMTFFPSVTIFRCCFVTETTAKDRQLQTPQSLFVDETQALSFVWWLLLEKDIGGMQSLYFFVWRVLLLK